MFDVHIDRLVPHAELVSALATAFSVPHHAVAVVPELTGAMPMSGVALLCTSTSSCGEFLHHVSIYPQDATFALPTEVAVAQSIARMCTCRCLVNDDGLTRERDTCSLDSANPFLWLLVEATSISRVSVDPDAMSRDELTLSAPRAR